MNVSGFKDTSAWYDQNAKQYAATTSGLADHDQIEEFSNLLPVKARVLDAGCAAGRDSELFRQRGFEVTGVDLSKRLLDIARQQYPDIDFIMADFLNLPFKNQAFDAVWAHQSLLHLETVDNVKNALKEFRRVLKVDGILLVLVKAKIGNDKTAIVSDAYSNHDRFFQYFTKDEIKDLLKEAKFKVEKVKQYSEHSKRAGRPEVELIYSVSRKSDLFNV